MLDCAIVGGLVVDGTGRPGMRADVGIRNGKIVEVGLLEESARRTIDASGLVVAPGFIDVHTHYDAQVMWDPGASPSSLHGVTSVIGGNCGFTIAPVSEDSADYVMRMLACVEGMPVASLEAALDFRWNTFAEWLEVLDGTLAVNAGFLVGHSTIRKLVMGDDWQNVATPVQVERMVQIVDESVSGGALGFSSSWGSAHGDHLGNFVPSRYATADELVRLASVLRSHPGTMLEFIPPLTPQWSDEVVDLMIDMSAGARRPLNWNLLAVGGGFGPEVYGPRLDVSDRAAERGAEIVALTLPIPMQLRVNLLTAIVYNSVPGWLKILALPLEAALQALSDPSTRRQLEAGANERRRERPSSFLDFGAMTVQSVSSPSLSDLVGRSVGDIARERHASDLDTFLDIAVADRLLACFATPLPGNDDESWRQRAQYWQDPRVLVGGSDAGAHVDMVSTFAFFTDFVGPTVRERRLLTLEDAVHKVTDAPARFYGLHNRGRVEPGFQADIVVFDADTVRTDDVVLRGDMPNNEYRLFADAIGITGVLVNGTQIVDDGKMTGDTPGTILRPPAR
jgi:N-acyl-D-aspartate/D-glutamate deacylase